MEDTIEVRQQSRLRTLYYWVALFALLTLMDDLTFGPVFWGLAQIHPLISVSAAFLIYWAFGSWLVFRGLRTNPGKIAAWFLNRFQLERKNAEIRVREEQLKRRISSVAWAVPMSVIFGGVITTLWLRRRGLVGDTTAKKVGVLLCAIYALEFALIHGFGIGGSFRSLIF